MSGGERSNELERLRTWKQEAMTLFDGLQDLGRALGLPLGTLITGPLAVEAANALRAQRDHVLRIAEDVLTDHASTTCNRLDTCACSMAALHREVRHLRDTETKETR